MLRLDDVRVANESLSHDTLDPPKLGPNSEAVVIIDTNDNAFGVFSIVKPLRSGPDLFDSDVLEVLETDRLAVDLVVERQGQESNRRHRIQSIGFTCGIVK